MLMTFELTYGRLYANIYENRLEQKVISLLF